jgi:hypothetical protein
MEGVELCLPLERSMSDVVARDFFDKLFLAHGKRHPVCRVDVLPRLHCEERG